MAYRAMSWHEGEEKMHTLTKVPKQDNPMNPTLTPRAAQQIQMYPLMALGTIDSNNDGRPWCTLWGGSKPMSQPIAPGGVIGIKAVIDAGFDPVANILLGKIDDGPVLKQAQGKRGDMVSVLSINLEQRSRVKLYGRMMGGALDANKTDEETPSNQTRGTAGAAQLVLKIEQSLGNCPKYLNKKVIVPHEDLHPQLISTDVRLCDEAINLIRQADMFFISSSHKDEDMDANHRGGPPGFVRVLQPESDGKTGSVLVWPEYSGNNLYQTLGNLITTPRAGLCIPNFSTGDVLYVTGDTEVLVNKEASELIAKTRLAVRLTVTGARFVKDGLGFRGQPFDDSASGRSPYNPRIRFLRRERTEEFSKTGSGPDVTAKLIKKTRLSPTITKFRFSLSDPTAYGPWKPGQYVAFDFSDELDMGYSHMRDDDPRSLNDDFLRTFTVSSAPNSLGIHGEEFEIMMRKVGNVTGWLAWQRPSSVEIGVRGFGGSFSFDIPDGEMGVFIAAGIGITPLVGQIGTVKNLKTRWSVNIRDVGVVVDVWNQCSEEIKDEMIVYLSGNEDDLVTDEDKNAFQQVTSSTYKVERRRMVKNDLTVLEDEVTKWYLCTAPAMRKTIQDWIPQQSIIFENFDY